MIAYRVELWCDGCPAHYEDSIVHDDQRAITGMERTLTAFAERDKWITDGQAHYCPKCQVQRKAS